MIQQKLLQFQRLNITIEKDAVNPHFKNSYSSLNEVLHKVKPELNKLGIAIFQSPSVDGLETILFDTEDNSHIRAFVPYINATDMQKLGGAITYARRYALVSMLALEDEDDDGNKASAQKPTSNNDLDF